MKKKKTVKKAAKKVKHGPPRNADRALRQHVAHLLKGGGAHIHFMDALDNFPPGKYGTFANALPHTAWQLLEHVRLAQWDILEFSRNPKHVSPNFPDGYWPRTPLPPHENSWEESVAAFQRNLQEMVRLVQNPRTDLFGKIRQGQEQTILREALLLADHNAYHLGQLVDLRRALGEWPES
ncbi:MAG: DinB family protein [Candidatus Acidiferrum sp.]